MKKFLSILLVLTLMLAVSACSSLAANPEDTVKSFLDSYKKGNMIEAAKYIQSANDDFDIKEFKEKFAKGEGDKTMQAFKNAFGKIEYEITDSKVEEDSAVVEAEITVPNLSTIVADIIQESLSLALSAAISEDGNEEDINSKMETMLLDKINGEDIPMVKKNVKINLEKKDDKWLIKIDEDLANSITGNLLEMTEALEQ